MSAERIPAYAGRAVFGVLVMVFGALLTLDNLDVVGKEVLDWFWPSALIALSVTQFLLARSTLHRLWSGLLAVVGAVWLAAAVLAPNLDVGLGDLLPVLIILAGGALLVGAAPQWRRGETQTGSSGTVHVFAVLSGQKRVLRDAAFSSANLGAFMGGSVLDLRHATLAPGGGVIDVAAMMGGIEIWVPEGWMVDGEVLPIMGGYEDKTRTPAFDTGDRLKIRGVVMMGAVEVKNKPSRIEDEDEDDD